MPLSGVVQEKKEGKIYIQVPDKEQACEHCAMRMFCKKSGEEERRIVLDDRPELQVGDEVLIEQEGNILTKTILLAYGIPLLFFIVGFFLGGLIEQELLPPELIRFLCACAGLLPAALFGRLGARRLSHSLEKHFQIKRKEAATL